MARDEASLTESSILPPWNPRPAARGVGGIGTFPPVTFPAAQPATLADTPRGLPSESDTPEEPWQPVWLAPQPAVSIQQPSLQLLSVGWEPKSPCQGLALWLPAGISHSCLRMLHIKLSLFKFLVWFLSSRTLSDTFVMELSIRGVVADHREFKQGFNAENLVPTGT